VKGEGVYGWLEGSPGKRHKIKEEGRLSKVTREKKCGDAGGTLLIEKQKKKEVCQSRPGFGKGDTMEENLLTQRSEIVGWGNLQRSRS